MPKHPAPLGGGAYRSASHWTGSATSTSWPNIPWAILADHGTIDVTISDPDNLDPAARHVMRVWRAHERTRRPGYDEVAARRLKALLMAKGPAPDNPPEPATSPSIAKPERKKGPGGIFLDRLWEFAHDYRHKAGGVRALAGKTKKEMLGLIDEEARRLGRTNLRREEVYRYIIGPLYARRGQAACPHPQEAVISGETSCSHHIPPQNHPL